MHPGKLEFFLFRQKGAERSQEVEDVPGFDTQTSKKIPQVVGIPLFGEDVRRDFLWKLYRTTRNLRHKVRGEKVPIALCVRSFLAYAMAKLDYI